MQLSYSTFAVVLTVLATGSSEVVAAPSNEGRTFNLCNQPNFGAVGKPWEHDSKPAAFCGQKPSTSGNWGTIPSWDGGDSVKCGGWNSLLKICNGGNPKAPLPYKCDPPHNFPSWWNQPKPAPTPLPTDCVKETKCTPAICNWSNWWSWSCLSSVNWSPKCTTTCTTPTAPSSTSSSAPSATSSAPPVAPTDYPVCNQKYQVQYTNFTIASIPNGVWYGQTRGAAVNDASYMTYTLASSPDECLKACDQIEGCVFVNSYIDRNDDELQYPKHQPGVYTCAMFSKCVGTERNDNWGGQDDPNDILESNGYCKSGACGV